MAREARRREHVKRVRAADEAFQARHAAVLRNSRQILVATMHQETTRIKATRMKKKLARATAGTTLATSSESSSESGSESGSESSSDSESEQQATAEQPDSPTKEVTYEQAREQQRWEQAPAPVVNRQNVRELVLDYMCILVPLAFCAIAGLMWMQHVHEEELHNQHALREEELRLAQLREEELRNQLAQQQADSDSFGLGLFCEECVFHDFSNLKKKLFEL